MRHTSTVINGYKHSLLVALALLPIPMGLYMWTQGVSSRGLVAHAAHEFIVAVAVGLSFAVGYVTWLCYRESREPYLRWLTLAFLGLGIVYAPHGILTSYSGPPALFLLFGPASRVVMAGFLFVGILHWSSGEDEVGRRGLWLPWVGGILAVLPLVALTAHSGWAPTARLVAELVTIALLFSAVGLIVARRLRAGLIGTNLAAIALFAQSCVIFIAATPWTHLWWFAHLVFSSGFLVLSFGVARAHLTTCSFRKVYSEMEMIARLAEKAADARAARRNGEILRRAVDAAERANAAKSRFLAAASHDIRQPLVPIKLFAELLETEVTEKGAQEIVGKMRSSLESLDALLSRLLDFSRVEAGAVQARREIVSLGPLLSRFHSDFTSVARAKGLEFRVVGSSLAVESDRVLLEQVLRNLIENAIRYTNRGRVLLGCRRRGGEVAICVVDTGIGIPADRQQAVFAEFYQIGNENRNRRLGLGLGLATVERLCALLGHSVALSSVVGRGTLFSVAAPVAEVRKPTRVCSERVYDPTALRVLLIEDDEEVGEAVAMAMERWGWTVAGARCCADAVAIVEADGLPDVVVTDLRLEPDLCGIDAIDRISGLAGRPLPAVIVTGDSAHERLSDAASGPWPVVLKPFAMQDLRNAVAEALVNKAAT